MSEHLPKNWIKITLPEIAEVNPKLDKSIFSDDLDISFVPMPAVEAETGEIDVSQIRKFKEVKKGYTPFQKDDVLFAKITPCMENGKMAVVPELSNGLGFGSTEFHVLRAREGIEPYYLYYYVSSKTFRYEAEHNMSGAVGQKRVPTTYIKKCLIPLPPSNEQKRIVNKIEELFEKVLEGENHLKKVVSHSNQALGLSMALRQSILIHAFSGKLVSQDPADEDAFFLLKRIKAAKQNTLKDKKGKAA